MKEDQAIEQNLKQTFQLFLEDESKEILKIYRYEKEPNFKNKIKDFFKEKNAIIKTKFVVEDNSEYLWIKKSIFSNEYKDFSKKSKTQIVRITDFNSKDQLEEKVYLYLRNKIF